MSPAKPYTSANRQLRISFAAPLTVIFSRAWSRKSCADLTALTLVVLLWSTCAFAGLNIWTSGGPFGGNIQQVVIDPNHAQTLYLVAENRAYKSSSGGLSWSLISNALMGSVNRLVVDPSNTNNIYTATSSGVHKSSDGGASWNASSLTANVRLLCLNPQTPAIVYAGNAGTLYRSVDGGVVWSAIASFSNLSLVTLAASSPATLYAISSGNPLKSIDGGMTWTPLTGLPSGTPTLAVAPTDANVVYAGSLYGPSLGCLWKSTDGGATWSSAGVCSNYTFYSIAISDSDPDNVFVSAYYGLYHSLTGGASWLSVGGLTAATNSLAFDPANPNIVYAGTQGSGVFRTADGGNTWASRSNGLTPVATGQLALARSNPGTLFVTGGGGVFKTSDHGGHWSPISPGTSPVYSLAIDQNFADVIYAGGNYGPSFAGVHKSADGGLSWIQTAHNRHANVFSIAIAPGNSNIIYAGAGGGGTGGSGFLSRTVDAGADWPIVAQLPANASNLAVDWFDPNIVYAVSGGSLLKSTDSGVTWNPANTGLSGVRSVTTDPNNSNVVYTGTNSGVFKSLNAGLSWSSTALNNATNSVVVVRGDSNKLYAGTSGFGVYQSTDAGATWAALNTGLTNLTVNSLAVDDTGRYLHASTSAGVFDYEYFPITPATHLTVTAPQITTAGNNLPVTVTALDATNQKAINYNGTIHFTSSDIAAGLPSDYTFVVKPNQQAASGNSILIQQDYNPLAVSGIGQQVLTSSPMTINSITVQFNNTFPKNGYAYMDLLKDDGTGNPSNAAADILATSTNSNNGLYGGNFTFTFPSVVIAPGAFHIVVRTQHVAPNGYSILSLTTSDRSTMNGLGSLTTQSPGTGNWSATASTQYMFFSINDPIFGDAGQHTFNAVLKTAGTQSITATDISNAAITGTQSAIVVQPNVTAGSLTVTGFPSPIDAGTSGDFTVTVRDAYGNIDTGYAGTIHFSSSDSQATLPPDYTFSRPVTQTATGSSILVQQDYDPLAVSGIGQRIVTASPLTINEVTVRFDNTFPKNGYAYMDLVKDDGAGKPSNSAADILGNSSNVNGGGYAGNFTFNFPAISVPAGTFHLVVRTQHIGANGYSTFSLITGNSSTLSGLSPVMTQSPANGQWSQASPDQFMYFSIAAGEGGVHTFSATLRSPGFQSITATAIATPGVNGAQSGIEVLNVAPPLPCDSPTATFAPAANYATGISALGIDSADFNRDGLPDLAVANFGSNTVSIFRGAVDGSFAALTNIPVGSGPFAVATGDLNNDGKPDLIAANSLSNSASILLGDGSGGFVLATTLTGLNSPRSLAVADLNHDGNRDVVIANFAASNNVKVFLGNGSGGFASPQTFVAGATPNSVTTGDFNNDGNLDLALANLNSNNISILIGAGTGVFGAATNIAVGTNPSFVRASDFNGDGKLDLAVSVAPNYVAILLGMGDGSFGAPTNFAVGTSPLSIATADFDRDGRPDLATTNGTSNDVSIILGAGDGTFGPAMNLAVGTLPRSAVVGDFNGDGLIDLANANQASNNVSVLLNQGPRCPTAITWNNPADITYGTPLGVTQLNATANVPGTLVYTPAAGTVLNAGNAQVLSATFTPDDPSTYGSATKQVLINVNKRDATWTTNPNSKTYGAADPAPLTTGSGNNFLPADGVSGSYARLAGETVNGSPYHINTSLSSAVPNALNNYNVTNNGANFNIFKAATAIALTSAPNPSGVGETITFTATVSALSPGGGTPTGNVEFRDGGSIFWVSTSLINGVATLTTSGLPLGPHTISAIYRGDNNFEQSGSAPLTHTVIKPPTTTTSLTASPNPSTLGQVVTFTARVTSSLSAPAGAVEFFDGLVSLGSSQLKNGVALLSTSALVAGTHSITAVYGGTKNFQGSTSPVVTQMVTKAATSTTGSINPNSAYYLATFTITTQVSSTTPAGVKPTGVVSVVGVRTGGGCPLVICDFRAEIRLDPSGRASVRIKQRVAGNYQVTLYYRGDNNFAPSQSAPMALTLTPSH